MAIIDVVKYADPDSQGMLGFTPASATVTIARGVATVTDTITVVAAESSTSDTLDKLAITNTSQYDLVYLFADTGDTITLTNTSSPSADGHIKTVSDSNETLSSTVPTILIRKGNYWYGYGGGVVNAVSDIGDVTITNNSSGEILKWNGSAWINQTLTEAGIVNGSLGTPSAITLTNATGLPATTGLTATGTKDATTFLRGDNTWATAGGGATAVHTFSNTTTTTYTGTASSFGTVGSGDRDIYIKKIDANNEGVFTKIWKNGAAVEVQIA